MSGNGPPYSADSFCEFATKYGLVHTTSSPRYPQANGEVDRAVRTAKSILRKNEEIFTALLTYRSTPLQNGLSSSKLLIGRRLRTQLPTHPDNLYLNVKVKERQTVELKESLIDRTSSLTLTSGIVLVNFQHSILVTMYG